VLDRQERRADTLPTTLSSAPLSGATHSVALEVLLHGPLSRSQLARRLGLSPGSLTRLTKPLLDRGLLMETGTHRDGRTGRPSTPLDIVAESRHFVGVKLTGDDAHGVLTNLRADVLASARRKLTSRQPTEVVAAVQALVTQLGSAVAQVHAVGVSLGGQTADRQSVTGAPFLEWTEDVPLSEMLSEATGLPVVVDNDLLALTKAAHWFGAGRGLDRFAMITTGAGVGYGLVVHGEIVDGPDAGIGLAGHFPLDAAGPRCPDGHRGCACAMLSIPSICSAVSAGLGRPVDYDTCLDLAAAGDPVAAGVVSAAGRALGRLVAAAANLTMAQKVILTGEGIRLAEVAAESVRQGIERDRDPRASRIELDVQTIDFTEWARGAAASAIQEFVRGNAGRQRAEYGEARGQAAGLANVEPHPQGPLWLLS
jgi:predicted NBD/HSP70 family sugar kinase